MDDGLGRFLYSYSDTLYDELVSAARFNNNLSLRRTLG